MSGYQSAVMDHLEDVAAEYNLTVTTEYTWGNTGVMLVGNGPGSVLFTVRFFFRAGEYARLDFGGGTEAADAVTLGGTEFPRRGFRVPITDNAKFHEMEAHFRDLCAAAAMGIVQAQGDTWRVTVRGPDVELRGRVAQPRDEEEPIIVRLARAMEPFGIVVASQIPTPVTEEA